MVAMAKSRAARTDRGSGLGVRSASLGKQVQPPAAGRGDSGQFPLAMAAIRKTGASHWQLMPMSPAALRARPASSVMAVRSGGVAAVRDKMRGKPHFPASTPQLQWPPARKLCKG